MHKTRFTDMKFEIETENGCHVIVDTDQAVSHWKEDTRWNGSNNISVATGSDRHHELLHLSRKGNYYLESWSNYEDVPNTARFVTPKEAALWLLANGHELPEGLAAFAQEIEE